MMDVLYFLLPLGAAFSIIAALCFCWASLSGQFDDLDTPAIRVLFESDGERDSKGK